MAYKKDIKPWLKENGYTWEDMDNFWKECCEVNWKCRKIAECGKTWSDLTMSQIKTLPKLKETTLKQQAEAERQKEFEEKQKKIKEEEEKYYSEHFDEIILNKLKNGEHLTEDEIKELVYEYEWEELEDGDKLRWTVVKHTVVKLGNKFFRIDWQQGLTEMQPNMFMDQPIEVELHEYEKTITVREWISK